MMVRLYLYAVEVLYPYHRMGTEALDITKAIEFHKTLIRFDLSRQAGFIAS